MERLLRKAKFIYKNYQSIKIIYYTPDDVNDIMRNVESKHNYFIFERMDSDIMEKKRTVRDLTEGTPIIQILLFSLPLVFGSLFQQLYSFADTVIVGRCIGMDALGAVGTTYSLHFLTLGFVQGFCVGLGIPIAKSFGAKDQAGLHRYFWNGLWLCVMISVVFSVGMTVAAVPLLKLMNTPAELLSMATVYIHIIFLGIPAAVLYNFSSGALRAVGDSKHPFYFLLFSSGLNILLDYVLIVPLRMGVAGAAIATVFSQLVSGCLNSWWLLEKNEVYRVRREEMAFSSSHAAGLCRIALPMGFEYSVSAIGAVVMQNAINSLGTAAVAAQTTGEKIRQMFTLPMESVGMAMATYAGQNYGAGNMERIRQGIKSGLVIQWVYCAVAWAVIYFTKGACVELVIGTSAGPEAEGAIRYLTLISTLFALHGALMVFRNVLQGLGHSFQAVLSGVGELAGRSIGGMAAISMTSFTVICYTNPLAWGLALVYCVIMVGAALRGKERTRGTVNHVSAA